MDPRNPLSQQIPPRMANNLQQAYGHPSANKMGTNGQHQFMTQPVRQPYPQTSHRSGRNVATVGPMTGKPQQMEGPPDMSADGSFTLPGQNMTPGIPNDPSVYQRGVPMYQNPFPPMMPPGPGIRGSNMPQQQPMFNQISDQMAVEMMHQQRFPPAHPPGGPRFANMPTPGPYPGDQGHSIPPMSGPEMAGSMPPMGPPGAYDGSFGVKPIPHGGCGGVGSSTMRPLAPLQSQQMFPQPQQFNNTHQHQMPPISSPVSAPQNVSVGSTNFRGGPMEMSDPNQRLPPPQPPMKMQQASLPPQQSIFTPPPPGAPAQFPLPPQGTLCSHCSRDLAAPPAPLKSAISAPPSSMSNYPPVQCDAGCREWFHLVCSGLSPEAFYLLKSEGPFVEWICSPCTARAHPNIPYIRLRSMT